MEKYQFYRYTKIRSFYNIGAWRDGTPVVDLQGEELGAQAWKGHDYGTQAVEYGIGELQPNSQKFWHNFQSFWYILEVRISEQISNTFFTSDYQVYNLFR